MRILLVKTSSLGDVIHNLPVVSDLRLIFPEAQIDWCVEEGFADLPRLHPAVGQVIPVAIRRWRRHLGSLATWREIGDFRRRIAATRYDFVLDTQGLLKSALIARQAQGRRLGYAAEVAREPLAARFYDATFVIPRNVHAVQRNRWLAAAAFDYAVDLPLDYGIVAPTIDSRWLAGERLVVLLTATSRDDKLWPERYWCALAEALLEEGLTARSAGRQRTRTRAGRTDRGGGCRRRRRAAAATAAGGCAAGPGEPRDRCRHRSRAPRCGLARADDRPLRGDRPGADRRLRHRLRAQSRRRRCPPLVAEVLRVAEQALR
jgi:heptosyltransferase-1